jgi:hypothetical protein
MYISKIDDLIDNVIDDFYVSVILKDKQLIKIFKEPNFVKFQAEINDLVKKYIETINLKDIKELVKSNEAMITISEIIKRYILFYLFLTIGFNYQSKIDTYINNIVEFTKNQPEFDFKVENFFNSESNSLVIKYNNMIQNMLNLLGSDQQKIDILKIKPDYKEVIVFLNTLGVEYINRNIRLDGEGVKGNKENQCHNIIKTIIVLLLYKTNEKKEIFRLLEMTEHLDEEYMFIDIVVPKQQYVDYSSIEKLIGSRSDVKNLSNYFWTFLKQYEEGMKKPPETVEEKISILIQSGMLTPICDDFLLYHKDSERYDRTIDPSKIKKKEDTKIRYIINKIDSTTELYSDQVKRDEKVKTNIKKQFYVPLLTKKAILVNHNEDVHIINKFLNQGKRSVENNEYFNDLLHYKSYPFVNFKDFEHAGFSITIPKTLDIVRYVSLTSDGDFRQRNKNNYLQMRIGSKDMTVNVVGFMISTNMMPIQCVKIKDSVDIRSLSKTLTNGNDLVLEYLKQSTLGTSNHNASVYWLFDLEKDSHIKNTENMTKNLISDQIKNTVGMLYDNILNEMYYVVVDELEKQQNLNVQMAYKILSILSKNIIGVPTDSELINKLETKIYEMIQKVDHEYDKNEDIVYGIHGDVIELPEYKKPERDKIQIININVSGISEYGTKIDTAPYIEGMCQHNITWDKISTLSKKNPKMYTDQLYAFIQQYVIENVEQDLVCKSCGTQLNIRKYIIDGVFDDATQKFVTYSMPMDVPLEDIPEYEKYKITIRNLDKLVEKIATVSNVPHLEKSSANVKWKRKAIVKDAIDVLLSNNKILKKTFKDRNETASKLYGINRDLSNLFIFELENSIFVFSSKDKDHYKPIKQNNILAYLIVLIALEINDSHVSFIGGDKKGLCNLQVFDKIYKSLFGDLKIRINNAGDTANITNYKILCYIIYILGCASIKYKMWFHEYKEGVQKKKYDPMIQKILVHTVVDVLNSILEIASQPGQSNLYEMLSIKTFKKLNTTFSNESLYNNLKNEGRVTIFENKMNFSNTDVKLVDLSGKYKQMNYIEAYRETCRTSKFYLNKKIHPYIKFYNVNNVTNCAGGEFHDWAPKGGKFVCNLCKSEANAINYNKTITNEILDKFKFVRLGKLAESICYVDGTHHQYLLENGTKICLKCKNTIDHKYNNKELEKLDNTMSKHDEMVNTNIIKQKQKINEDISNESSYVDKVIENVKKSYNEKSDLFGFIDVLLDEIQSTVGNETGTGTGIYLRENSYIINHDHLGFNLEKEVIITDNKKIYFKENHPSFKTDVIYYTSHKTGKIDVFYDATTKILLGYKEESKNVVYEKKQDRRLIINYSILNKLKLLGYPSQFMDMTSNYENMIEGMEDLDIDKNQLNISIVSEIIKNRIENLKHVIYEFQRILYRLMNNYNQVIDDHDETEYFSNIMNSFVVKYRKKINDIKLVGDKGEHQIFKHWKGIVRGVFAEDLKQVRFNFEEHKIINSDDINKIDKNGNLILFFIVKEITKLLQYNSNKFTKATIISFILDFINTVFELFNVEKLSNNIDIKRFHYILTSQTYVNEVAEKSGVKNIEGIYSEYVEEEQEISQDDKDKHEDAVEEAEALDMEESDYQGENEFDKIHEWEPSREVIYNPNYQFVE